MLAAAAHYAARSAPARHPAPGKHAGPHGASAPQEAREGCQEIVLNNMTPKELYVHVQVLIWLQAIKAHQYRYH